MFAHAIDQYCSEEAAAAEALKQLILCTLFLANFWPTFAIQHQSIAIIKKK